jgi:hypothetical protein
MRLVVLLVLVAVSAIGCQSAAEAVTGGPKQLEPTLLVGKCRAIDFGNHVVLYATGFNGCTGVKSGLKRESGADGVLQFRLYGELQPGQAVGAAMTPFLVSEALPPLDRKLVRVHDARGVHDVPVEPAEAISYAEWAKLAYPKTATPPQ